MRFTTGVAPEYSRRVRASYAVPLLCFMVVLSTSASDACATALGSLSTSVGMLAALAALFVIKGWPAHLPLSVMSASCSALLIVGAALWFFWRVSSMVRPVAMADEPARSTKHVLPFRTRVPLVNHIELPAGFDRDELLAELRRQFVQLQHAWDHAEMGALRTLVVPEMLQELCLELRESTEIDRLNSTEIVTLRAELLGFDSMPQVFVASVEFSGLLRDSAESGAAPFKELWLLTQSKQPGSAWRLAKHQVLV